jgi:hypothetical protein
MRRKEQESRSDPSQRRSRRQFFRAIAGGTVAATALARSTDAAQPSPSTDRQFWVDVVRRLADPVLNNLASERLKVRMPVEQADGANREPVTHLEALGRLVAGMAPWIELPPDDTAEGRLRAKQGTHAAGIDRSSVDPASRDFQFHEGRPALVDAAFWGRASSRAARVA